MENKADNSLESAIETALSSLNNIFLDEEVYHAYCEDAPDFPFIVSKKEFVNFVIKIPVIYLILARTNFVLYSGEKQKYLQ